MAKKLKKMSHGTSRSSKISGDRKARNTDLDLFLGDAGWSFVGIMSEYYAILLHLCYNGRDRETGDIRRRYFPCAKTVEMELGDDGKTSMDKGDEDCYLCELSVTNNDLAWRLGKIFSGAYFACIARKKKGEKKWQDVQKLFIWSYDEDAQDCIDEIEDFEPKKTRVLVTSKKQDRFTLNTPSLYSGSAQKPNDDLKTAFKEALKNNVLEAFATPPDYDEQEKAMKEHFKSIGGFDDDELSGGGKPSAQSSRKKKDDDGGLDDDESTEKANELNDEDIDGALDD